MNNCWVIINTRDIYINIYIHFLYIVYCKDTIPNYEVILLFSDAICCNQSNIDLGFF